MKKVFTFEIFQWIEVEAESKDEALALIPKPSNEGEKYSVINEGVILVGEAENMVYEVIEEEEGER